jgi:hypothetical protein
VVVFVVCLYVGVCFFIVVRGVKIIVVAGVVCDVFCWVIVLSSRVVDIQVLVMIVGGWGWFDLSLFSHTYCVSVSVVIALLEIVGLVCALINQHSLVLALVTQGVLGWSCALVTQGALG